VNTKGESAAIPGDGAGAADRGASTGASRDQIGVASACLIGNLISPTPIIYGPIGLFLIPISHEFGWPRERVSGVLGPFALVTALAYPFIGRLADHLGPRRLIRFGNVAFGLCVIALGFAQPNVILFYGLFALIGAVGSLPSSMMYTRVVSGWFDKTRGAILGVTAGLGNGVGATIMPVIALVLMGWFGWRGAFIGLGLVVLAVGIPSLMLLLKEPPTTRATPAASTERLDGLTLPEAARTPTFWLMLAAIGMGAGCLTAVMAHIVPMLSDRHIPVAQGTLVVSVFAMVTAAFQIIVGLLLDRSGSPKLVAPLYIVALAGLLLLEFGSSLPVFLLGGALMGVGMGTEYGVLPYFISRYFGLRRFGAIAGVMYSAVIIAQGITPYLMDVDFDRHKTYLLSLHVVDVTLVVGAAILAALPRYGATKGRWKAEPAGA
jgi:MFS family permease